MGLLFPVAVGVIAHCWAWLETLAMANPLIAENFYYRDRSTMLAWGSLFYALYFVVSFPFFILWMKIKRSAGASGARLSPRWQ